MSLKSHEVKSSGACDVLKPDNLRRQRECGVKLVETRLTWWELEPQPNALDWTRFELDLSRIKRAELKTGVFVWWQYPPPWYAENGKGHARYRCLQHDKDSSILSLWDPKTLDVYDRLYGALAHEFGNALDFIYVGISGDHGEAAYPSGGGHYVFSPEHSHEGLWCGDPRARRSFAEAMYTKYGSLDALNRAWGTAFTSWRQDLMPRIPFSVNALVIRCDFMRWYTRALADFTERVCNVFRSHFPKVPAAVPIRPAEETLAAGQVKSLVVKAIAQHGLTARWTGMGSLKPFARSNVLARRVATAAHFYGAAYGAEASPDSDVRNVASALYECQANGASLVHDEPVNVMRSLDVQRRLRPKLTVEPPRTPLAVFYPVESEMLQTGESSMALFMDRAAELRARADYDVCDSYMIWDDFLQRKTDLVFLTPCLVPHYTTRMVVNFIERGGRVWLYRDAQAIQLFDNVSLSDLAAEAGFPEQTAASAECLGLYRIEEWPPFEPYASLAREYGVDGNEAFLTVHERHISHYLVDKADIILHHRRHTEQGE